MVKPKTMVSCGEYERQHYRSFISRLKIWVLNYKLINYQTNGESRDDSQGGRYIARRIISVGPCWMLSANPISTVLSFGSVYWAILSQASIEYLRSVTERDSIARLCRTDAFSAIFIIGWKSSPYMSCSLLSKYLLFLLGDPNRLAITITFSLTLWLYTSFFKMLYFKSLFVII